MVSSPAAAGELLVSDNPAVEGSNVTFTATANDGWGFLRWEHNGATISSDASFVYTIPTGAEQTYTAYFAAQRNISLTGNYASTSDWSLVNNTRPGSSTFYEGDEVTFTATPNDGYAVETLTFNGNNITSPYNFTVGASDIAIVANFQSPTMYAFGARTEMSSRGTVSQSPSGSSFAGGAQVEITATPRNASWVFDHWDMSLTNGGEVVATYTANPYTHTFTSDAYFIARFVAPPAPTTYTLTVATADANGQVYIDVENNPTTASLTAGTQVNIVSTPAEGYRHQYWTSNAVNYNDATMQVTMPEGDVTYTASYVQTHLFTLSQPAEGGSAQITAVGSQPHDGRYDHGTQITVRVTPTDGYYISAWKVNGVDQQSSDEEFTTTINSDLTVQPVLSAFQYNLTAQVNGNGGTASVDNAVVGYNGTATWTATADECYDFVEWDDHSTNPTLEVTGITSDVTHTATFQIKQNTVTLTPVEHGTVTYQGNLTFNCGSSVTLTAVPDEYYDFVEWNDHVTDATRTVSTTATLYPVFAQQQFTLTIGIAAGEGTTDPTVGQHTYNAGTTDVEVSATPAEGYRFKEWNLGTDNPYTFATINGNYNINANFVATYTFAATAEGNGSVEFQADAPAYNGRYDEGTSFTVSATAETGYHIDHWTVNGQTVAAADEIAVDNIAANTTVVAFFAIDNFNFTATAGEGGDASVDLATADYGTTVTFTATPDACHDFVSWSDNSTDPVHTVTATENLDLTATFSVKTYTVTLGTSTYGYATTEPAQITEVECGGSVTIRAYATTEGYHFAGWSDGESDNPHVYTNVSDEIEVTPLFEQDAPVVNYYDITLTVDETYGTVTYDVASLNDIEENTQVTFTAAPNEGYRPVWNIAGVESTGDLQKTVTVTDDMTISVSFEAVPVVNGHTVTITVVPAGDENVTVLGEGITRQSAGVFTTTVEDGGSKTITAYANGNPNYTFVAWMCTAPYSVVTTEAYTLTNVTSDIALTLIYNVTPSLDVDYLIYENETTKEIVTGVNDDYRAVVTTLAIPASVRTIRNRAFHDCSSLVNIIIPEGVESTGNYLFDGCTVLNTVTYAGATTEMGTYTFNGCEALQNVTLPASMTELPEGTFYGCSTLPTVTLPESIETVGDYAFKGCSSIISLTMPNAVTEIGAQAFGQMSGLRYITIGNGTESIDADAFTGVSNLVNTNFTGNLENWMAIDFENALANPMAQSRNLAINGQVITNLTIPETITAVKKYTFFFDTLITSITMSSVETIADSAFYRLTKLNTITLNGYTELPTVSEHAFEAVVKPNVTVIVPCELYATAVSTNWGGFTNFRAENLPVLNLVQTPGGTIGVAEGFELSCDNPYNTKIMATAALNYRFVTWSDGIAANPRTIDMTNIAELTLSAIWEHNTNGNVTSVRHITFEDGTIDQASFYSYSAGANSWVIGEAAANSNGTWGGTKGMYVSNDAGSHNNYSDDAMPSYTYAEFLLRSGYYEISFDYNVAGNDGDNLVVALFDAETDPDGLNLADGQILHAAITGDGLEWGNKTRMVNIPAQGWYRLAFFWNTTDDSDVDNPGAAIDNIFVNYINNVGNRFAHVAVASNDDNMGHAIAYVDPNTNQPYTEHDYYFGQEIEISAVTVSDEYRFVRWDDGNTDQVRQLNFEDLWGMNQVYTAIFEPVPTHYTVSVVTEDGVPAVATYGVVAGNDYAGSEGVETSLTIDLNTNATLYLTLPQGGWAFLGWWDGVNDTITDNPYTYTERTDVEYTAIIKQYRECDGVAFEDYDNNGNPRFIHIGLYDTDMDDDVIVTNVVVGVENHQIMIEDAMGAEVNVYDAVGRKLTSRISDAYKLYIDVPASGAYMVKIGEYLTKKVVVIK